jgi:hypothetical protein
VTGHVIYADTQQPARLASVVLQPMVDPHSVALTPRTADSKAEGVFHLTPTGLDGSYTIANVLPGRYYVIVEQAGYVSPLSMFSRDQLNHPDDAMMQKIARYLTPVSVTSGHVAQGDVRLIRGGEISGTVHFDDGAPAIGVAVNLLHKDEKGQWVPARTRHLNGFGSLRTDERGGYRFDGLPADEYLVRASIELEDVIVDHIFRESGSSSSGNGYRLRLFPGDAMRTKDAKPLKVDEGQEVNGNDIDVPVSKLYSLSGTVGRTDSALPVNSAHLTLNFADDGTELASTDVDANDGTFRFEFVPAGSFVLKATGVAEVQRTEVSNCQGIQGGCIPPTHTEKKVIAKFGDVSMPLEIQGETSGVVVNAPAAARRQTAGADQ